MISDETAYLITVILTAVGSLLLATGMLAATPERLPFWERLARHKLAALFLGWAALAICVPHAKVVSPEILVPFLWPIAVAFPVLGYFYLDFPMARAVAGAMILGAYYVLHLSFNLKAPGAEMLAIFSWGFGLAGIWVSARPRAFRDAFRLAAKRRWFKYLVAADLIVYALLQIVSVWACLIRK